MSQFRKIVETELNKVGLSLYESSTIKSSIDELADNGQLEDLDLDEDTIKQGNSWTNKGKEGTHGKFKTKKEADNQRKAMFANGYKG